MNTDNLEFFNPTRNDCFSKLRGMDLQNLIMAIENFYLTYRNTLNLSDKITFGVEIEYEKANLDQSEVQHFLLHKVSHDWNVKTDGSLINGGEITSPVMCDQEICWKELKLVCKFLKSREVNTSENAGGHIHVGTHILGDNWDTWRQFLKFYTVYESIFFRFVYGDKLNARQGLEKYARPIADNLRKYLMFISESYWYNDLKVSLTRERRLAINFINVNFSYLDRYRDGNTIEFRSPNGTSEEVIWQNNINCIVKMLLSPTHGQIDEEYLDYKLKKEPISPVKNWVNYNEISLKMALEFVDMVFDNNLDKVYFLRQYFKNFEITHGETTVLAKKMVK